MFHPDEWIRVRGIPVKKIEVALFEQKFGGHLFDECLFDDMRRKEACANVIVALDAKLRMMREASGNPSLMPDAVDIGDPGWLYIPVGFGGITMLRSTNKPAGVVAWFRIKKHYKGAKVGHNSSSNRR